MLLWARKWHRGLGDDACVVDDIADSGRGRWQRFKGLDRGWERRRRGSEEDSMMAQRLQGGLNDDTGSREVDDGVGSREFFDGKFW
jgi:hypothetical protein